MNVNYKKQLPIHNETGAALVSVLMVFVVFLILGVSLLGTVAGNLQRTSGERNSHATYYIAEAGMNYKLKDIQLQVEQAYEQSTTPIPFFEKIEENLNDETITAFETSFGEQPKAKVKIKELSGGGGRQPERKFQIHSTGTIGNQSRTVATTFTLTWQQKQQNTYIPDEMAVFTVEPFTVKGSTKIIGNIGTLSSEPNAITIQKNSNHEGEIFEGVQLEEGELLEMPSFPTIPDYPKHQSITHYTDRLILDQNYTFSEINLKTDVIIDTQDSDKQIVVDQLFLNGNDIHITGNGKLNIFVSEQLNLDGGSINKHGSTAYLNLYLEGAGQQIVLKGNQVINGSIFAEDADIELRPGGGNNQGSHNGIRGHIFSGGDQFSLQGNAWTTSKLIYMPNAHFELSGGGGTTNITGAIVAKSIGGKAKGNHGKGNQNKSFFNNNWWDRGNADNGNTPGNTQNVLNGNIEIQYGLTDDVPLPVETGSSDDKVDIDNLFTRDPIREVNHDD
ncbi:hypothetical protein GWK91_15770 [Virgibacillus sp. MSP4-1]|uniref:pilus assembly PilX N-terminal domain-containing protein n=1 Tax=Virgibacillus sp. MSP4-1 TaxID=2700081 RepID=UPI0003A4FA34|nr:pilus assembly PilX N-terminal domain-containing protein [Virgibacillus sp. MSP4-1]QHS24263.1 hypothetical protein GWK91_15770 [Virgibacillus sp. MSP4-1]